MTTAYDNNDSYNYVGCFMCHDNHVFNVQRCFKPYRIGQDVSVWCVFKYLYLLFVVQCYVTRDVIKVYSVTTKMHNYYVNQFVNTFQNMR